MFDLRVGSHQEQQQRGSYHEDDRVDDDDAHEQSPGRPTDEPKQAAARCDACRDDDRHHPSSRALLEYPGYKGP
jgi:hypothetical protein